MRHVRGGVGGRGKGKAAGPKEVALELGRVGFDYDAKEDSDFAALTLQDCDQGRDRDVGGSGGGGDGVLVDVSPRETLSVHRRPDSRGRRAESGAQPMRHRGGRVGGLPSPLSPLRKEVALGEGVQDDDLDEQDALLGDKSSNG